MKQLNIALNRRSVTKARKAIASAAVAPISGQMLGGRIWYSWLFAPAMLVGSL